MSTSAQEMLGIALLILVAGFTFRECNATMNSDTCRKTCLEAKHTAKDCRELCN
jgi:hypothetical protein